MQIYKLTVSETKHGILIEQSDFAIAIDADTLENGIRAMKEKIEQEGVLRLRRGECIPESNIDISDTSTIFIQVDIDKKFRDSASQSVRKNISMPEWMDIQLRYYNVDASKLFQDAANAYLEKKKPITRVKYRPISITSVQELIAQVDKEILDEYILQKLL